MTAHSSPKSLYTLRQMHECRYFYWKSIYHWCHMEPVVPVEQSLMLICTSHPSLIYSHTHIGTHTRKHHPIFQIRLLHGSFPPSSPLKMTVADISTHSEGKRGDISSWVRKLGSNYIALSRQPWLLLTRPDIWSVSAGYQFWSLPSIQHWADSLCYVFWMLSRPIRYCFAGRMFSSTGY